MIFKFMCAIKDSMKRGLVIVIMVLFAVVVLQKCEESPLPAPEGTELKIYVKPKIIGPGETADITVIGTEKNGTPLRDGVEIFFDASLGTVEPESALTKGGKVEAKFYAGYILGTATIIARARGGIEVSATVEIVEEEEEEGGGS